MMLKSEFLRLTTNKEFVSDIGLFKEKSTEKYADETQLKKIKE